MKDRDEKEKPDHGQSALDEQVDRVSEPGATSVTPPEPQRPNPSYAVLRKALAIAEKW